MAHFRKYKTSKGETKFKAEIRIKGIKPYSKSFNRLSDAKLWAKEQDDLALKQAAGIHEMNKYTVSEAIDRYIDEYLPTIKNETSSYALEWWRREIGLRYLHTIRPAEITALRNKLAKEPKRQKKRGYDRQVALMIFYDFFDNSQSKARTLFFVCHIRF